MQVTRCAVVAMIGSLLLLSGCKQDKIAEKHHPAKIDSTEVQGIMRVTLEPRAAERIGLQTAPVREENVMLAGRIETRSVVPYGAIMYDTKGESWTFTNPQPLVFVRTQIVVERIDGNRAILAEGPPPGTIVVTVGASELMGAEHKYGH